MNITTKYKSNTKIDTTNTHRPVFITSENITNETADNARMNSIVNNLKRLGVYAENWGLGPNSHISIMEQKEIPKNALIVNIYGGACAGTLFEMGLNWYKKLKASKRFTRFSGHQPSL